MTPADFRAARQKLGSQPEVAAMLGISKRTIQDYEAEGPNAKGPPKMACLAIRWLVVYGVHWTKMKGRQMTDTTEIKPCPFCGGKDITNLNSGEACRCYKCGAVAPLVWRDAYVMGCNGFKADIYQVCMGRLRIGDMVQDHGTDFEAKAAAQADYERRNLSALVHE